MDAPHNFSCGPVMKIFVSLKPEVNYVLLCCNPEQITESLLLENRCQDSRRRSFWSQRYITGRALAEHCSFKCIHVLTVYSHFYRYSISIMLK